MAKPLNDNLKAVRVETDDGDLIQIMDVAGLKFSELIRQDRVFKSAVADELAIIKEGTGLQVIAGTSGI